jgi:DNA-binding transcriptional regulator YbjK
MKRQRVAEHWNDFSRQVLNPALGAEERRQMRRAFYSGAASMVFGIITSVAPGSVATPEDIAVMKEVHQELREYAERAKRGTV